MSERTEQSKVTDLIDRYLASLREHLAGSDPATMQDALADAEDHLRTALAQERASNPQVSEAEALNRIIGQYGKPEEVAKAYRELENRQAPSFFAPPPTAVKKSPVQRFFGVVGDPRAYAALFFMLFSLISGIIYFTWAVTGISLSLGLMVTILGLPFFGLFVFSVQGLSLVEGRLIEALLGIRMPRRPAAARPGKGIWGKFKARVTDPRVWTTVLYMILKLPLGVLSFSVFVVLLAYSLQLIMIPVIQMVFNYPLFVIGDARFWAPFWVMPILVLAGLLDLIVVLHFARFTARGYGALAKAMLVRG